MGVHAMASQTLAGKFVAVAGEAKELGAPISDPSRLARLLRRACGTGPPKAPRTPRKG